MTVGLPLTNNVLIPLAKSVLIPLGLTTAVSETDAAIQIKIFGSGITLIISNEEMEDIMKIVKPFEESGLLIKWISKTDKNEAKKNKKGETLGMLLGKLVASLLGSALTGQRVTRANKE